MKENVYPSNPMQQIVKILENPVYAQLGAELTDDCGNYKDSI